MKRIREIVTELAETHGLNTHQDFAQDLLCATALAEFLDAVRALPLDGDVRDECHIAAREIAASIIARLLPEIASDLSARLADRRISEAA